MSTSARVPYRMLSTLTRIAASGTETRRRSRQVLVRLDDDEHRRFTELAERHQTSVPNLLRLCAEAAAYQEGIA